MLISGQPGVHLPGVVQCAAMDMNQAVGFSSRRMAPRWEAVRTPPCSSPEQEDSMPMGG